MKTEGKIPPVVRLQYVSGDLIIKEGDFGLSIYEIISGKVGIFVDSSGTEIQVATLGPGMIIGEMSFLAGTSSPRSASARALEDCCLEAWHPNMITTAYKQMPTILRLITGQSLKSLVRVNKMVSGFNSIKRRAEVEQVQGSSDPWSSKRSFYRKEFDKECVYRPVNSPKNLKLFGRIKDISRGGMQMDVKTSNSLDYSHVPGDEFLVSVYLKPGQQVNMTAKIVKLQKGETSGTISMGMTFTHMTQEDQKKLGFFLMP